MKRFTEFPLKIDLLEALHQMRFLRCTPIQEKAIPIALEGLDISGMAQTGTGKTLAFLIPILDKLVPNGHVQTLVVCPTRELAIQVGKVATDLGGRVGVKTSVVYGGTALGYQRKELYAGPDMVVGTPGRVIDFIRTSVIRLKYVKWLVLDEADRMLDMGFIDDVDFILKSSPPSRQTMLFSATLPPEVLRIAGRYMHEPSEVKVSPQTLLADKVNQTVFRVSEDRKTDLLAALMRKEKPTLTLVFTATREATTLIARRLRTFGFEAGSLSSLQTQKTREGIVRMFKEGEFRVLVATDVAARGLDIDGISHVFNYDISYDAEDHVHRIGRTARAGRDGRAITFVSGHKDERRLQAIEKLTRLPIAVGEHELATGGGRGAPSRDGRSGGGSRDRGRRSEARSGSRGRDRGRSPVRASPVTASPVETGAGDDSGGSPASPDRKKRRRRRRPSSGKGGGGARGS